MTTAGATRTRADDSPQTASRIRQARREGRKMTIVLSIVAAGVTSLFIGRAIEVQSQNDQVDRNRTNCEATQDDRYERIDTLYEAAAASAQQANATLGSRSPLIYTPPKGDARVGTLSRGKPIPAADFTKKPFKQFSDFKPLIITQAHGQRESAKRNLRRAARVQQRIENCNRVFPKNKTFWIF